jgi:hypothetical protein
MNHGTLGVDADEIPLDELQRAATTCIERREIAAD